MMLILLVAALLLAPSAAQANQARRAAPAGTTVTVRVTDRSGNLQEGVQVTAEGPVRREGATGADGLVAFRTMAAGTYRVRAEGEAFITLEKEITVRAGTPLTTDMSLAATPAVEPPPPPPPPAAAEAPVVLPGEPRSLSIPDLAERSLGGREAVKQLPIGCSGLSNTELWIVRETLVPEARDADAMLYLVAGEATLTLGDQDQALMPGWFSLVPRGTSYTVTRRGRNPAIVLSTISGEPCQQQ